MAHAAERTLAEQLVQITADTVTLEGNLSLPERRRGRAGAALRLEQYGDQPEIQDEHPHFSTFPSLQGWRSGDCPPCFLVGVSLAGVRSHERCFRQLVAFGGAPHVLALREWRKVEPRHVKCQQAEPIVVWAARRWAGAAIAHPAEVVHCLMRANRSLAAYRS
jgi:hypothetical protein